MSNEKILFLKRIKEKIASGLCESAIYRFIFCPTLLRLSLSKCLSPLGEEALFLRQKWLANHALYSRREERFAHRVEFV